MSRNPPFPTSSNRRAKSPGPGSYTPSAPPIQPLSINRPTSSSRPVTPGSRTPPSQPSIPNANPNAGISSPARPARSGLRSRVISQTSDFSTGSTYISDPSQPSSSNAFDSAFPRQARPARPARAEARESDVFQSTDLSMSQLNALSAFKQAGVRRARRDDERDLDRQKEVQLDQERQRRMKERTMGRRPKGSKAKSGDLDAVLDDVRYEWESVLEPDFNPVELALYLLDEKDQGRSMESFRNTKYQLEKALKGTIDKNYRAFEAALPHHNSLLHSLGTTQGQVSAIRSSLQDVKETVGNKRADLVQFWSRGQQIDEIIKIFDQIEYLKTVPDMLETLMSEKRLLPASALLMSSLKIICNESMRDIGALADLKSYLSGQETALREILIEELHSHLYLKTFWCDSRWASYNPGQQCFPTVTFEEDAPANVDIKTDPPEQKRSPGTRLVQFLRELTLKPNEPPFDPATIDLSSHPSALAQNLNALSGRPVSVAQSGPSTTPETDSFAYLETILESLAVLGRLSNALGVTIQRLPVEIHSLVDGTIGEVSDRSESLSRTNSVPFIDGGRPSSVYTLVGTGGARVSMIEGHAQGLRLAALEMSVKEDKRELLRDLFWSLYSKLDAVLQGMRVISEVANRISSRRGFKESSENKKTSLFPLQEQWGSIQGEVQTLLHEYLVDEETNPSTGRNPINSINEVLRTSHDRGSSQIRAQDVGKVFRFADAEGKSVSKVLRAHEDGLSRTLNNSAPGLATAGNEPSTYTSFSSLGGDDRVSATGHHQLLLTPDVFYIGILFEPTLAFLDRVVDTLPSGADLARSASHFLDDFVLNMYIPQLEDKVTNLFHLAVSGPDAFRESIHYRTLYSRPLMKASVQITALINSLCSLLDSTPFHKDSHSRLIIGVIAQFYHHCNEQFRDLVTREKADDAKVPIILAVQWAQNNNIAEIVRALKDNSSGDAKLEILRRESELELTLASAVEVTDDDLLPSMKQFGSVCLLFNSLSWFIQQLATLMPQDEPSTGTPPDPQSARTPFTPHLPATLVKSVIGPLHLHLTQELSTRFTTILQSFRQLSELILNSIRLEIRCRVIKHLQRMSILGNFQLDRESQEPDMFISQLNADLINCQEISEASLQEVENKFLYEGMENLISNLLVFSARKIRTMNEKGYIRIQRNILALQQSLKSIYPPKQGESTLEQAKNYWLLYKLQPEQLLESVRTERIHTFEEYETMLNLICGQDRTSNKNLNSFLIELHEVAGQA